MKLIEAYLDNRFVKVVNILGAQAPGTFPSLTVPTNKKWILLNFVTRFAADVNVANRLFLVEYERSGQTYARARANALTVASGVVRFIGDRNITTSAAVLQQSNVQIPFNTLEAGDILRFTVENIQVGDVFTEFNVSYLEFDVTNPS